MNAHPLSQKDQAELVELEEALWRQETRFDLVFQEQRFASDFIEFGRSGRTYTRDELIRTDSSPIRAKLPLPNMKLRALDNNTVLITYDSEATYDGVVEYAHRSSLWSRSPGGWVIRFHQGTPYQPSPPVLGDESAA